MIKQSTRDEIHKLIGDITDQVFRYFGDPSVVEPFELKFDRGDESIEHSRLVGEGARLGLSDDLHPMSVSVTVDEDAYRFKVERI